MPYKRVGNKILVKRGSKWVVKYTHDTADQAQQQLEALYVHDPHAKGGGKKRRKK